MSNFKPLSLPPLRSDTRFQNSSAPTTSGAQFLTTVPEPRDSSSVLGANESASASAYPTPNKLLALLVNPSFPRNVSNGNHLASVKFRKGRFFESYHRWTIWNFWKFNGTRVGKYKNISHAENDAVAVFRQQVARLSTDESEPLSTAPKPKTPSFAVQIFLDFRAQSSEPLSWKRKIACKRAGSLEFASSYMRAKLRSRSQFSKWEVRAFFLAPGRGSKAVEPYRSPSLETMTPEPFSKFFTAKIGVLSFGALELLFMPCLPTSIEEQKLDWLRTLTEDQCQFFLSLLCISRSKLRFLQQTSRIRNQK